MSTSRPRIRALTLFHHTLPTFDDLITLSKRATIFCQALSTDYTIETIRLALSSPAVFPSPSDCLVFAQSHQCHPPFTHMSLGTIHPSTPPQFRDPAFIASLISSTSTAFISVSVIDAQGAIHPPSVILAAQVIQLLKHTEPGGTANMRFAALASVKPGCPFLPAAYSSTNPLHSTTALGISVCSFLKHGGLKALRTNVETSASHIHNLLTPITEAVSFDFSVAPEIGDDAAGTIQVLSAVRGGEGADSLVGAGWVAATGFVTAELAKCTVDSKVGFWGVMMPVAEDSQLAKGVGHMNLLAVSSICGCGLDVVPVPGHSTVQDLERVVMDIAVMSARLRGKPLTARIMPVPGKNAGDVTVFDSPYLVNGRVVDIGNTTRDLTWGGSDVSKLGASR